MTTLDKLLQKWRASKVAPYLSRQARVLDIGCGDGSLFRQFTGRFREGIGIDPGLRRSVDDGSCRLIAGSFPGALRDSRPFDVITLLAVLEHVPPPEQAKLAGDIADRLKNGGHLVVTVPSPLVDPILNALRTLGLVHGMSLEQHYGFRTEQTPHIFGSKGLRLVRQRRFQLGLNNLFVFQKVAA